MAGRFTPQLLDEIRNRITVSDVVGRRVQLKKQGREFAGLSPFNAEKTPSFTVNDQKGFYHCFSSGKHGDQFTFLMETEGLSFPEAVEQLAKEAGVELPKVDPRQIEKQKERAPLYDIVEMACAFFERELRGARGATARRALADRGIDGNVAARFRIGYAPASRSALKEHLSAKGIPDARMVEAGLLIAGEDIETPYDRFRDRITFAITDQKGRPIAFGARAMGDAKPKYLNSPETELFHKGATLFNHMAARRAAHDAERIVCVEGYVDVIACARAGIEEAVAPLGTALTETQLQMLWRAADEPVLCFDGDGAGIRAAHRAIDLALPFLQPGKSLRFAFLPDGQDPDDLLRAQGAEALKAAVAATRPLADVLWERELEAGSIDTPERKAALDARMKALLGQIQDGNVRKHYLDDARDRLFRLYRPVRRPAKRRDDWRKADEGKASDHVSPTLERSGRLSRAGASASDREAILLALLVHQPGLVSDYAEAIAEIDFTASDHNALRSALLGRDDDDAVKSLLDVPQLAGVMARLAKTASRLGIRQAEPGANAAEAEIVWLQALHQHRRPDAQAEVEAARAAFEAEGDEGAWLRLQHAREDVLRREHEDAELEGTSESNRTLDQVLDKVMRDVNAAPKRRRS